MTKKFYVMTNTGRRMSMQYPPRASMPKLSIGFELSRNNTGIAQRVILHGLLQGDVRVRKEIVRKLRKLSTWPTFVVYLIAHVIRDVRKDFRFKITDEYVFRKIESFGLDVYHEHSERSMLRSYLSTVAQAMYLRPDIHQIRKAMRLVQRSAEREVAGGWDYGRGNSEYMKRRLKRGWLPKEFDPRRPRK